MNRIKWRWAYIGCGSNVGNRLRHLRRAEVCLEQHPLIRVEKRSSVYETAPVGPRQRDYLNGVLAVRTPLDPFELLRVLQNIESRMKRVRGEKWGPRTLDLGLLFYERVRLRHPRLILPHPEFSKRKFVLRPMAEIAPRYRPPGFRKNIRQIAAALTDSRQRVKLFR